MSKRTQFWIKCAMVRAIKTMAQVASGMIVIGAFNETAWALMVQASLAAGLASLVTSLAGLPEVDMKEWDDESSN